MRKRWITAVAALGLAAGLGAGLATATGATPHSAPARPQAVAASARVNDLGRALGTGFTAKMSGGIEVPAGDPNATGTALFRLSPSEGLVCFHVVVNGETQPIIAMHIHQAPAGTAGPVVIPLITPTASGSAQESKGCVAADPSLIRQIIASPAQFYVNVHTKAFPAGAARGQLVKLKEKPLKTKTCPKPKKKMKNR
jgi:CHRD domain